MSAEFTPMSTSSQEMIQQLSGQLHLVSEIAESLTLRLLALEERHHKLSAYLESVEPEQTDDSNSFSLLADSNDRLEQLRGLLHERSEELIPQETPRLEAVGDSHFDPGPTMEEFEDFDLEPTVYVNDSQEEPSDTLDPEMEQNDQLLSA
jgi:hypothetical protein